MAGCMQETSIRQLLVLCLLISILTVSFMFIPSVSKQFSEGGYFGSNNNNNNNEAEQQQQEQEDIDIQIKSDTPNAYEKLQEHLHRGNNSVISFKRDMQAFPWDEYSEAARKGNSDHTDRYSQLLISKLLPYLIEPPFVPIDETCKPPPLRDIDCGKYDRVFSGQRDQPAKIGHMIQLGFDVDILEIHLNELYDVVDYFFILESTITHYHKLKKPLMWEQVMLQDRFIKFQDKVVHLILDDTDEMMGSDMFTVERHQESRRWQKFVEWNKHHNVFQDTDIIGFGDTDEISNRNNLNLLKHCAMRDSIHKVDIGIWFPMGPVDQVFKPGWPVPNNPYTLGDPTYFKMSEAIRQGDPSRNRGTSGNYMLGGMHMSHYGYLPFQITKRLSCSECGIKTETQVLEFGKDLKDGKIVELERRLADTPSHFKPRVTKLSAMDQFYKEEVAILPWFYNCNRDRYPVWEAKDDTRILT